MPGEATDSGANVAVDAITKRGAGTTYLALSRSVAGGGSAPTDTAAGTELAVAGYARQPVTWSAPGVGSTGGRSSKNSTLLTFGPFTVDPQEVGFAELYDASTAGTRLFYWTADAVKDAAVGESIQIAIDSLELEVE